MIFNGNPLVKGCCLIAASALSVTTLHAGYVYDLTEKEFDNGEVAETSSSEILVDGSKIKVTGYSGGSSEVIFDAKEKEMLIVDHDQKSYTRLDQETIEAMAGQISDAMAKMEEQMANMPPAQRKMMEKMMKGRMPQAAEKEPEPTLQRTGETKEVAGYEAEKVELTSPNGKVRELWVAPWSELEGSEGVAEAFQGMSQLFDGVIEAFSQGPMAGLGQRLQSAWLEEVYSLDGFPVMVRELGESGELLKETLLADIEQRDIPASAFDAPKGYKRQKISQ